VKFIRKAANQIEKYLVIYEKNLSRIRKKTFYLQYNIGLLNGSEQIQTEIIMEKSETPPNIRIQVTRRNLQDRPKFKIKWSEHQINLSNRKISPKKSMLASQK
jgi:hypothetical protein